MDPERLLRRKSRVLGRRCGERLQLLVVGTGTVVEVGGVAAMVWNGLDRPGSRHDLLDAMLEIARPVGGRAVAGDLVDEAIELLSGHGLVIGSGVPAP